MREGGVPSYLLIMADGNVTWVKLDLDIATFDPTPFLADIRSVEESGIELTTLATLGDTPEQRRSLYDLNAECLRDIPGRGEFHSWDEYQRVRFGSSSFDPIGVTLALDANQWVGMSSLSHREGYDYAFAEMTGTVRSHRGRGLATAMKVAGIAFARQLGMTNIRTVHHPGNAAMITLNRKLGFVDGAWDYPTN